MPCYENHSCKQNQLLIFFPHFFNLSHGKSVCSPLRVDCKIEIFMWICPLNLKAAWLLQSMRPNHFLLWGRPIWWVTFSSLQDLLSVVRCLTFLSYDLSCFNSDRFSGKSVLLEIKFSLLSRSLFYFLSFNHLTGLLWTLNQLLDYLCQQLMQLFLKLLFSHCACWPFPPKKVLRLRECDIEATTWSNALILVEACWLVHIFMARL